MLLGIQIIKITKVNITIHKSATPTPYPRSPVAVRDAAVDSDQHFQHDLQTRMCSPFLSAPAPPRYQRKLRRFLYGLNENLHNVAKPFSRWKMSQPVHLTHNAILAATCGSSMKSLLTCLRECCNNAQTAAQTVSLRLIEQRDYFGIIEYYHHESRHLTADESQSTKAL